MNPARPDRPQDQPHDEDLSQLYRDAARDEPPAALDRMILEAAWTEAARTARAVRRPWWRSWLAPVTAFATVVLTFTLTLLVHQEREREEAKARSEQHKPAAPAQAPAAAPSEPAAPTMKQDRADTPRPAEPAPVPQRLQRGERTARPGDLSSVPPRESEGRRADAPPLGKAMPEAFPGAMKEEAAAPVQSRSQEAGPAPVAPASGDSLPAPPPPAAVAPAAPRPAPFPQPAPAAEAKRKAAPAAGAATGAATEISRMRDGRAEPLEDRALRAPEDWLEDIRALKRQGREREAQEALARFRRAYPDYALPGDLR